MTLHAARFAGRAAQLRMVLAFMPVNQGMQAFLGNDLPVSAKVTVDQDIEGSRGFTLVEKEFMTLDLQPARVVQNRCQLSLV
ncbi:MAG: hypothetical protein R3293_19480 [Candidatus Promineifilaceae bacterium]|nr:hypothetical protein [Candidatus Promineifilaceae bacterium]